uniref:Small ribosomal subunit protein uS3m n=1 Tax=Nechamandra alternifolia TaxID=55481 RepID=A0A1Z1R1V4_9LILI|nr:ribosomal protein S3 [Nechamandra alternifolia]
MARKGNPISVRLSQNRSSDSSRFSDSYYGQSVYQDVNLRSYFGSIRPPTISTFGFRLGRCLLLHCPKGTFIHFFLPRGQKGLDESRPGTKEKGQWWAFGKVGPIGCLHESKGTEEERTDVAATTYREAVGGATWGGLRREKQNEPKPMQRYGYHVPSIKFQSLRGASVHPKDLGLFHDRDFLFLSLRQTKFFQFCLPNQSRSDGPRSHLLKRTLPAVRPSFHSSVMQYWRNTKNKMHFDPVYVLNHFVAPGVSEPSRIRGAKRGVKHRIRSRIALFVESSTCEKQCLAQAKIAGTTKTTISLFPFFGATFFFPREGVLSTLKGREPLWSQFSTKCWNLMGQDQVMELIEKCRELGSTRELIKGIEILIEIILRNRQIPYGYNSYLNEVNKMRSFLSERTKTETSIESVKIQSVYQSASPIAQDISFQPRNKRISFRSILSHIVKADVVGVEGIRICCSGRSEGAEISRTECGKYGKTSRNVLEQKIDYAPAEVSTRYGILGVKVWISYR